MSRLRDLFATHLSVEFTDSEVDAISQIAQRGHYEEGQ